MWAALFLPSLFPASPPFTPDIARRVVAAITPARRYARASERQADAALFPRPRACRCISMAGMSELAGKPRCDHGCVAADAKMNRLPTRR
jgi:hypothetical protein